MTHSQGLKDIFITGGAGFIGANLVSYLLDMEVPNITIYDNLTTGSKENLFKAVGDTGFTRINLVKADILDFNSLGSAIKRHSAVVHLAAHTQVRQSISDPGPHLAENSHGTFNVIEAARINGVEKFVFASSNAAVGEQIPPINESMVPKPLSPYGAVKLYGEALCSAYYNCYDLKTAALRFANAYGLHSSHKTSVIAKYLQNIKAGKPLAVYGDGTQTRDFINARDIARAIYLVLTHDSSEPSPWGKVFQIATGIETRIIDLAEIIMKATGSRDEIIFTEAVKGEIRQNFSDISRARKILGFEAAIGLQQGIEEMCRIPT